MPTMFEIFGLRFFFHSDEHRPIHIHVVRSDDNTEIQVEDEVKLVYNHGLRTKNLKRALGLVGMYKEDIIDVRNEYY